MKRISFLILIIWIQFCVNAQEVTVSTAFDTSRIYLGDQIFYTITVDQPADLDLTLKPIKDTLCKNIEIISGPLTDSSATTDGTLRIRNRYLITSFDSGFYQVPPTYAELANDNGIKRFYSDYSLLEVARVKMTPPDSASQIFDIIKPYRAPLTVGEIVPWLLLTGLAALFIYGIFLLLRRFKKSGKEQDIVINPDPAHVIAFRELEKLRQEQLWQKGEVKQYYSRLTEIIRQYLEDRYGVYSLEMTTSETLEALIRTGFRKDEAYENLKSILNGSDLVKFAKYKPEPSENEAHFENSWRFVETTMIQDQTGESVKNISEKEAGS